MIDKPTSELLKQAFLSNFAFRSDAWLIPLHYKLPGEQALPEGCIIDIETTGLSPDTDHILAIGVLARGAAGVLQLTKPEYDKFRIRKTQDSPKPRYGYASHFEAEFLSVKDDHAELARGTLKSILRQANITREDFLKLL
jgi:hypothetical protein